MKPCDGNHPGREARPGSWTPGQCRVCWLWLNEPAFRMAWEDDATAPLLGPPRHLPCVYLGEVVDRLGCPCPGKWLRGCALHGACTLEGCKRCPDYEAAE